MSLPTSANLSLSQINSCLRITNGNIGVGTTAPAYKLDIVGNVNATALSQAGAPLVGGSTFNAMSTFSTTATLTTTSPSDIEVSGQIGPVTIALPANNTSGNIITVHNVGGTTGSTSSDVFVRTGVSTTSGSLARISPGESVTTMALQTAGTTPRSYQKTISRKGGKGIEWTERVIPNTRSWRGIAWAPELGLFCATTVGAAFVMTSPDGITWTERSIPNNRGWYGICWAPELGLFCSVNLGGAAFVMTSPDGITWTERSIPNTRNWISVVWAPELRLFCAVNNNSAAFVMTSPDGITWTERSIPTTRAWRGLAWSPELGLFCASNDASAAVVMTSPNGTTWTERAIPGNRQWFRLTWAPELGLFCAVNYASAAVVMTSADGVSWTERAIPNSRAWYDISWAPELGLFCAVVNGVAVVMTSPDGITWTERSIPNARAYISVVWSPELMSFCAVPHGGTAVVLTSFGVPLNIQSAPTSTTMGSTASLTTNTVNYTMGNFFTDTTGTGIYDYTLTANPQSSGSLSAGVLSVTGNYRNTSYTVTVMGRNGINRTAGSSLTVNEANGAPIATTLGSSGTLTNNTVQYTLSSYFTAPAGTGTITYSLVANPQSSASISSGVLSVTGNYRNTTYTVTVRGTNSYGSADSSLSVTEATPPDLYSFTSQSFTNAGVTGRNGPTLSQIRSAYGGTWQQNSSYLNMTTQGVQLWTVPKAGTYRITCRGQQNPGLNNSGAQLVVTKSLTRSQVIKIVVGQVSETGTNVGGHGASFVVDNSNNLIVIAGGAGGTYLVNNMNNPNAVTTVTNGNIITSFMNASSSQASGISGGVNGSELFGGDGGSGFNTLISDPLGRDTGAYSATYGRGGFGGGGSSTYLSNAYPGATYPHWRGAGGGGGFNGGNGSNYGSGGGGSSNHSASLQSSTTLTGYSSPIVLIEFIS